MKKYSIQLKISSSRAFTLVEALFAISVFTVSILAMMAVLSDGIADTNYAKKKIIAVYLAQEGMEFTRNMRDTFMLFSGVSGWSSFQAKLSTAQCTGANGCYYNDGSLAWTGDPTQPIIDVPFVACAGVCPTMLYNSATGKYGYAGTDSGFVRRIKATVVSGNELKIFSTVYWGQGSGTYSVTLTENLFNWVE
jgi:type II secretory pathway pseudopilin PulG